MKCENCSKPIKLNHGTYGTWIHSATLNTGCYNPNEKQQVATPAKSRFKPESQHYEAGASSI